MKLSATAALALFAAGEVIDVDEDCSFEDEVCLMQTGRFLDKGIHGDSTGECPGAPLLVNAQIDSCAFEGVTIHTKDMTGIEEWFDDNVQMKEFHWYLNGDKRVWVNLATHPFQVGTSVVTVEGTDLAGNTRKCHRTITVEDTQKPKWHVTPGSVDSEITLQVDENCERTGTSVFKEYEELGWEAAATDNCGGVTVTKQIKKDGVILVDDSNSEGTGNTLSGPGTYEIVYIAEDLHGRRTIHTAVLTLEDKSAPTEIQGCPVGFFVEIEATAHEGTQLWGLPQVSKDNCLAHGTLPTPVDVNGHNPGKFPVGETWIQYPMYDSFGNIYEKECRFVVEVKQKAHPVIITCPADVTVTTLELAGFGVPIWPDPTATQGGAPLLPEHISYKHGVSSGLPFPYGTTSVIVEAKGAVTGTRTGEAEQGDECTFNVQVKDPYRPHVDGRKFRCEAGADAAMVEPYGVCSGTDVSVTLHPGYADTGAYDLVGTTKASGQCCSDEHGSAFSCQSGPTAKFNYCQPAGSAPQIDAPEERITYSPTATVEVATATQFTPPPQAPKITSGTDAPTAPPMGGGTSLDDSKATTK